MKLTGKRALVVGGSGAIGGETARRLAAAGAQLVLTGRSARAVEDVADGLATGCGVVMGDVQLVSFWTELTDHVQATLGGLDIVVFASGVMRTGSVDTIGLEDAELVMRTNLWGTMLGLRHVSPLLSEGASCVLVASSAGVRPIADFGVYTTSKAALIHLTAACALDWASRSIRVNCVCPGVVPGPLHGRLEWPDEKLFYDMMRRATPAGRLGTPGDVAEVIMFLAGEASEWMTGAALTIDGGLSLI